MAMLLREPARPAVIREHRLAPWFAVGTVCSGAFSAARWRPGEAARR
jgi:hypothetical protein